MFYKTELGRSVILSYYQETKVIFNENIEFCVTPEKLEKNDVIFHLNNFKGDFEIIEIVVNNRKLEYDKENKKFVLCKAYEDRYIDDDNRFFFTILANIKYKKVGYVNVKYNMKFSKDRLRHLKLFEYFEEYFVLPKYEYMKFKYCILKTREYGGEIFIENPLKIQIENGYTKTTDDFKCDFNFDFDLEDGIDFSLTFIFDPLNDKNLKQKTVSLKANHNALAEIMSNTDFADVVIFSSSNKEILSYRCVLAKYSTYFAKRFEEAKEIPVKFNLKDDDTDTIKAALDFCYGKAEAIKGKEAKLLEFANKYSFENLKNACSDCIGKH